VCSCVCSCVCVCVCLRVCMCARTHACTEASWLQLLEPSCVQEWSSMHWGRKWMAQTSVPRKSCHQSYISWCDTWSYYSHTYLDVTPDHSTVIHILMWHLIILQSYISWCDTWSYYNHTYLDATPNYTTIIHILMRHLIILQSYISWCDT
jgi:hypothetical protein